MKDGVIFDIILNVLILTRTKCISLIDLTRYLTASRNLFKLLYIVSFTLDSFPWDKTSIDQLG